MVDTKKSIKEEINEMKDKMKETIENMLQIAEKSREINSEIEKKYGHLL